MAVVIDKVEKTRRGNKVEFKATFDLHPTDEDIENAQQKAGYHSAGYGGPSGIVRNVVANGVVVRWWCFASSD